MAYFEINPTQEILRLYVECFWVHQTRAIPKFTQWVLPDGCLDVIYYLPGFELSLEVPYLRQRIVPSIVGTMTKPTTTPLYPGQDYLGIRFKPGGFASLMRTPLYTFTDTTSPLDGFHPSLGSSLQKQLEQLSNWSERIGLLETHLLDCLYYSSAQLPPIVTAVQYLLSEKGNVSIPRLSRAACLSPRQLERLFNQYVGVAPKLLARIIRFRHVKAILETNTEDSLMGIAFDSGYTDHAHLTKEFKAFAGLTPSAYQKR
jgi:AraC-like DNA-binding protein